MPYLSIISPVYNAERILTLLIERIECSVQKITLNYEIILVEDCGEDNSWMVIENIAKKNPKVVGIKLSRNFGQHYAITAGLDYAKGDWMVVMDCDLQDQPEEIINLYNTAQTGFDIVLAKRFERKDSFFKKFFSKIFYRTLGYLTGSEQDETISSFGIYNKKVIDAVVSMREPTRYFPTMIQWVGFNSAKINVVHHERRDGKSGYSFQKLIDLAIDIILANSDKPIKLLIKGGLIISLISVLVAIVYIIKWFRGDILILGYTSLIISIWLLSGVILSTLGIIGLYVGKIFEGVKNRPIYIISKIIRNNNSDVKSTQAFNE